MKPDIVIQGIRDKLKELDFEQDRIAEERKGLLTALAIFERDADAGSLTTEPKEPTYSEELVEAIREILSDEQPLHRREILNRAKARGIAFTAKNQIRTVGYYLSREPDFKNVARGTWALVGYDESDAPTTAKMRLVK